MSNSNIEKIIGLYGGEQPDYDQLVEQVLYQRNMQIEMREAIRKMASLTLEIDEIIEEEREKANTRGNKIIGRSSEFSEKAKSYEDINLIIKTILQDVRNV